MKENMNEFILVIGNKNYSSWSLRPWLVLKYFQIPFEEIFIPLRQPDSKGKILQYSPSGQVPVLKHNQVTVWDSIAICEYLNDLFPEKGLWPRQVKARAWARAISAEMHAGFMALRKNCPVDIKAKKAIRERTPDVDKDIQRIIAIWEECRDRFQKDGDFLFGSFSIADAMFAPVIFRFQTYGIASELSGIGRKYFETMFNLPVMQEWAEQAARETQVIAH